MSSFWSYDRVPQDSQPDLLHHSAMSGMQFAVGTATRNHLDSNDARIISRDEIDDLEYLTIDKDFEQYTAIESPASPQKLKRKRQHRDKLPRSFEGPGVLPQEGEMEWDPSKLLYHTGKWPIEEERYANRLVLEFEAGVLEDCRDGVTLRSYLAKTLRCAPMRVSKKLAGKCIGSKVFCRQHGDRKVFLQKIARGELNIPGLHRRTKTKSSSTERRAIKLIRSRSTSDLTDDEISSGSSSCTEDGDSDTLVSKKQATTKRKYVTSQRNGEVLSPRNLQTVSDDMSVPDDIFVCPLLSDFDSNIIDYGSDFCSSDASGSSDESAQHALDLGYDEWRDALSYFKESSCTSAFSEE